MFSTSFDGYVSSFEELHAAASVEKSRPEARKTHEHKLTCLACEHLTENGSRSGRTRKSTARVLDSFMRAHDVFDMI